MRIKGFKAAAAATNMRYKDRFDLGLIVADSPAAWAGVFTQSRCQASPVIWSRKSCELGYGRAFLANAGQANAQTGQEGDNNCLISASLVAENLGFQPQEVMLASTGVIGQQINMPALKAGIPALLNSLKDSTLPDFAQSILTTDTCVKTAFEEIELEGANVKIWGCAKGSGMIAPNMATMLAFIISDVKIDPSLLQNILKEGADLSFNRVSVDGDTSTNDSLMMMASGLSGVDVARSAPVLEKFKEAAFKLMKNLARMIAKDGEGASKLVTVRVCGALNEDDARKAARTVSESPLVKTAFFGCDANWGRICMALGRSGAVFDPYKIDINLNDVPWIRKGIDNKHEEAATEVMKKSEYLLNINLNAGSYEYEMLTCDYSHDYISINGSYRS